MLRTSGGALIQSIDGTVGGGAGDRAPCDRRRTGFRKLGAGRFVERGRQQENGEQRRRLVVDRCTAGFTRQLLRSNVQRAGLGRLPRLAAHESRRQLQVERLGVGAVLGFTGFGRRSLSNRDQQCLARQPGRVRRLRRLQLGLERRRLVGFAAVDGGVSERRRQDHPHSDEGRRRRNRSDRVESIELHEYSSGPLERRLDNPPEIRRVVDALAGTRASADEQRQSASRNHSG